MHKKNIPLDYGEGEDYTTWLRGGFVDMRNMKMNARIGSIIIYIYI